MAHARELICSAFGGAAWRQVNDLIQTIQQTEDKPDPKLTQKKQEDAECDAWTPPSKKRSHIK